MRSKETVSHRITSGYLEMDKKFFAKESFKSGSYLRQLLGLEGGYSEKVKEMKRDGDLVKVIYGNRDIVFVPDDVKGFARKVREAYGEEIKGRITVSMYFGHMDFLDVQVDF